MQFTNPKNDAYIQKTSEKFIEILAQYIIADKK
jgi:hypothetical protein